MYLSTIAAFVGTAAAATQFSVGQNYFDEWQDFQSGIETPAGVSVYGDIYSGALNSDSESLMKSYTGTGYVEIGLSWKDNMINNGYTIYQGAKLCDDIASGKFDAQLNALASYLTGFPNVKFIIRPDYEVSGNLHANTNPNQFDPSTFDFTAYPKAFAHVRSVINSKVSNAQYIFHPVRGSAADLYPGDDVVDFQGFSIFNNDVCLPVGTTTNCDGQRLDPNILKDIQFATKPKWVAESAPQPPSSDSAAGIIDYLGRVRDMVEQYDFAGWTYINSNWPAHGWDTATWGDSRVEANSDVKSWFESNISTNPNYIFG